VCGVVVYGDECGVKGMVGCDVLCGDWWCRVVVVVGV
jgi:hypothetical protein